MKRTVLAILAIAFACSSLALAQDDAAKKAKMEDKPAVLKSVTCDPACGFAVKGYDESELVSMVQMHSKKHHGADMSEADVKKMMKEEGMVKKEVKMEKKEEKEEEK